MFKKIALGAAALLAFFVVFVALQPTTFKVARFRTMAATPAEVFPHVNDFHNWQAWSPWAKRDPKAAATFEGPASGEGAIFRWAGNDEVGEGSMRIVESRPNERIRIQLDFVKPYEATSEAEFTFKKQDNETMVIWTMTGKNDFFGKAMCLFMNMDKMVGGDFEQGLANMKSVVEDKSKPIGEEKSKPADERKSEPGVEGKSKAKQVLEEKVHPN